MKSNTTADSRRHAHRFDVPEQRATTLLIGGSPELLVRCREVLRDVGLVVEHLASPSARAIGKLHPRLLLTTREAYAEDPLLFTTASSAAHAMLLLLSEESDATEIRALVGWALGTPSEPPT
jgi:hypothetical protein